MAKHRRNPIVLAVTAALAVGLGLASAPAQAEQASLDDSAFAEALDAYERNHWPRAFQALAELADGGHAEAARWAWLMVRHGPALYHQHFDPDPQRRQRWLTLASPLDQEEQP